MTMRLFRLMELHQRIDDALRQERHRRRPNPLTLSALKMRKLLIKDRIRSAFGTMATA